MSEEQTDDRVTPSPGTDGRDERSEDERRSGVTLEQLYGLLQKSLDKNTDTHRAVERLEKKQDKNHAEVIDRVEDLEGAVWPDGKPPARKPAKSISEIAEENVGALDEFKGYVAKLESKLVGRLDKLDAEQQANTKITEKQARVMGVTAIEGASFLRKLGVAIFSRAGLAFALQAIILYAVLTGRGVDIAARAQKLLSGDLSAVAAPATSP